MSTHFAPKNAEFPAPNSHVDEELYHDAHRNFAIGYADAVLRDPATGNIFLAQRTVEPEKGSTWFMGGRSRAGETVEESVKRHVERDTGLSLGPERFVDVSHFQIMHVTPRDGQEPAVRDARNNVLVANLSQDEVAQLNATVAKDGLNKNKHGDGGWYDPDDVIVNKGGRFPDPVRQFVRDYFDYQMMVGAIHEQANADNKLRAEA